MLAGCSSWRHHVGALMEDGILDHYAVGIGVDSLLAGLDRVGPLAAGVDVEVQPVLDGLGLGDYVNQMLGPWPCGSLIRSAPSARFLVGYPEVAVVVVPGGETAGGGLARSRGRRPRSGEPVGLAQSMTSWNLTATVCLHSLVVLELARGIRQLSPDQHEYEVPDGDGR